MTISRDGVRRAQIESPRYTVQSRFVLRRRRTVVAKSLAPAFERPRPERTFSFSPMSGDLPARRALAYGRNAAALRGFRFCADAAHAMLKHERDRQCMERTPRA
jgi:hypothetical protein